jgi:hypothetical protein
MSKFIDFALSEPNDPNRFISFNRKKEIVYPKEMNGLTDRNSHQKHVGFTKISMKKM